MISKTDLGELEFQIGYYTEMKCKTMGKTDSGFDMVLVDEWNNNEYSAIQFVLEFYYDNTMRTVRLLHTHEICGHITVEVITLIQRGIDTFNRLNER